MALDFNPHAPSMLGPEFGNTGNAYKPIDSPSKGYAARFEAQVSEGVGRLHMSLGPFGALIGSNYPMVVDCWEEGDEPIEDVQLTFVAPNALNAVANVTDQGGAALTAADLVTSGDGQYARSDVTSGVFEVGFDTTGFAGRQILNIACLVRSNLSTVVGLDQISGFVSRISAIQHFTGGADVEDRYAYFGETFQEAAADEWYRWDESTIGLFTHGGVDGAWVTISNNSPNGYEWQVDTVSLLVAHCLDKRVAHGAGSSALPPYGPNQWSRFELTQPVPWNKVAGTRYSVLLRQPHAIGSWTTQPSCTWNAVGGIGGLPSPVAAQVSLHEVVLDPAVRQPFGPGSFSDALPELPTILLGAPGLRPESQVYTLSAAVPVYGLHPARQEMTPPGTETYDALVMLLAPSPDPAAEVSVVVKQALITKGGPVTMTSAQIAAFPPAGIGDLRRVAVLLDPPATINVGTQAYVELATSAAVSAANAFGVGGLFFEPSNPLAGQTAQSFGGGTDEGIGVLPVIGAFPSASVGGDLQILLVALPDGPTNLHAWPYEQDVVVVDGNRCSPRAIEGIRLSWEPSPMDDFGWYEIQRTDTFTGATYQMVRRIFTQNTSEWVDMEARLGYASVYTIRAVRSYDLAATPWVSAPEWVVPEAKGCELTFTSNKRPDLSVAYGDVYERRTEKRWQFPEADERVISSLYGREGRVAFKQAERRGVDFRRTLLVSAMTNPIPHAGVAAFDQLRDLAAAELPYVCVRSYDGNRWYSSIAVGEATIREPGAFYYADVEVNETSFEPSPDV